MAGIVDRCEAVEARLDRAIGGLVEATPASLQSCTGLMQAAVREMTEIQGEGAFWRIEPGALAAAERLQRRVRHTQRLLQNLWRFHERWGELSGIRSGGYLAGGQAATMAQSGSFALRG